MTLVYARATSEICFIVADTLLTFPVRNSEKKPIEESHALKVHILNGQTAIAFAGDVDTSLFIINQIYNELIQDQNVVVPFRIWQLYDDLIKQSIDRQHNCDFLVLQLKNEGNTLTFITNNGISNYTQIFIGDENAYNRMRILQQKYRYIPPKIQFIQQADGIFYQSSSYMSESEIEFQEVSNAMEALCNEQSKDKSVGAVAGSICRVVDARHSRNLEYLQYIESTVSVEEGHTGYTILASNSGRRGIGIYYRSGKLGFIFIAGDIRKCRKEYAEKLTKFIEIAKKNYNLELQGAMWNE